MAARTSSTRSSAARVIPQWHQRAPSKRPRLNEASRNNVDPQAQELAQLLSQPSHPNNSFPRPRTRSTNQIKVTVLTSVAPGDRAEHPELGSASPDNHLRDARPPLRSRLAATRMCPRQSSPVGARNEVTSTNLTSPRPLTRPAPQASGRALASAPRAREIWSLITYTLTGGMINNGQPCHTSCHTAIARTWTDKPLVRTTFSGARSRGPQSDCVRNK
jgi:hypothetical protein